VSEFRRGEWVVVERLNDEGWVREDQWVVGQRAIVHGDYSEGEVQVWLPAGEPIGQHDLWILDAELLSSTGEIDEAAEDRIHDEASCSRLRQLGLE
jgi:hypothetical protein